MKNEPFNQLESIKHTNMKLNPFRLRKSKWSEISLTLLKIAASKVNSLKISEAGSDKTSGLQKQEEQFKMNGTTKKESESIESTYGEIWSSQRSQNLLVKHWAKLTIHTFHQFQSSLLFQFFKQTKMK